MSGDVQTRSRRKDKKKPKREDDTAVPGVDTSKFNETDKRASVQMHVPEHDHDHSESAGMCAKIVFFALMAILLSLVVLIVIENRGGSDVDTPLSESRFSEYLQGWVDEKREEEHHDPIVSYEEHDDHDDPHEKVHDNEPYPEEKDISNPDDNDDTESQELNAEININQSEQENLSKEADDNESPNSQEENQSEQENDDNNANIFEDSAPFDEEKIIKGDSLKEQVDELYNTYNEIADMLGRERLDSNNMQHKDSIIKKYSKDDDDEIDDVTENVIDNDEGEDLLLQKIAEESEMSHQKVHESSGNDDDENQDSSSLMTTVGVGVLLCIVAHQIIIKKSATKSAAAEQVMTITNEDILSKRRYTMLSNSEELFDSEEIDNEEIIEVMMVTGSDLNVMEINHDDLSEERFTDEDESEDESYRDENVEEFCVELHPEEPQCFEDFKNMYRQEPSEVFAENVSSEKNIQLNEANQSSMKDVETELPPINVSSEPEYNDYFPESEEEMEEEIEEEQEISDEELIDDEDIDYSDEISDIDDADLLKRLDEKYGKISDKNSEDEWTKIPAEEEGGGAQSYIEELLRQQTLEENSTIREIYQRAKSLDALAEKEKSNKKLLDAIESYKQLIMSYGNHLNDTIFIEIAKKCIERMRFIGKMKQAVDIHFELIHRFREEPSYKNQLAVTYLLANRLSAAKLVLHEILSRWRYNGFALVHYGFVLKNLDQDYEQAVLYLKEGIETNEPGTQDGRFYFNLGDALQRLGRNEEAKEIYRKGAAMGIFLSESQRSLYNIDRLKSKPFWTKVETTYKEEFMEISKYWQIIRDEGLKLLSKEGFFVDEQENLKDTGDWKQFELFARGMQTKKCHQAPITCKLISNFKAASNCKRGQVKFSVLHPNTHVHSHCGPTNTRIRAHLGLSVPEKTFLRVADELRSWQNGEWLIFDDSFEHEVWNNASTTRLVLIVDVWHPDITQLERTSLSSI